MVSLFLLLGCNLSYIVDLFAALHELASASAHTLLKLASSVCALLKPHGDTLTVYLFRSVQCSPIHFVVVVVNLLFTVIKSMICLKPTAVQLLSQDKFTQRFSLVQNASYTVQIK